MEQKFCTKCGNPIVKGGAFCTSCGAALPKQPVQTSLYTPQPQPEQPQSVQPQPEQPQPVQPQPVQPQPVQPQPVQPQPVQSQPSAAPAAPKKPAKRKAGALLVSIYLCVTIFVLASCLNVVMGLRRVTTAEKGTELAMSAFRGIDLTEVKAAKVVADDDYKGSVADWIVERAMEESADKDQFDKKDFENYLAESKMIKSLTEHTGSLVWDIRNGVEGEELTTDDMRKMLENDKKMIKKHLNFNINEKDIDKIITELERTKALDYTNPGTLQRKAPALYYTIQYGLSDMVVMGLAALLAVCALLLFLVNRGRLRTFFGDMGVTLIFAGGACVCCSLALVAFGGWLFDSFKKLSFFGGAVSFVASNSMLPAMITLALGVGLLVAKLFIKKERA